MGMSVFKPVTIIVIALATMTDGARLMMSKKVKNYSNPNVGFATV